MLRLLLDTNIVIDALARRAPFDEPASLLLMLGKLGEAELYMSSSQVTDVFFVLSDGGRRSQHAQAKEKLRRLREAVRISALTEEDIDAAIASTWEDFEDACVHQAALKVKADVLVTRNKADFARSYMPALDCEELFAKIRAEQGIDYAIIDL